MTNSTRNGPEVQHVHPWDPEATELRESLRELAYIIYRDTPLKWLIHKLGMRPKSWIREREERDKGV